jgi:hypothetical protein
MVDFDQNARIRPDSLDGTITKTVKTPDAIIDLRQHSGGRSRQRAGSPVRLTRSSAFPMPDSTPLDVLASTPFLSAAISVARFLCNRIRLAHL